MGYRRLYFHLVSSGDIHSISFTLDFDIRFNFAHVCITLFVFKNGLTINTKQFSNGQEAKDRRVGFVSGKQIEV